MNKKGVFFTLALLFVMCSQSSQDLTGGVTDTPNAKMAKVSGIAHYENGDVAVSASVRLRGKDYLENLENNYSGGTPSSQLNATTDTAGFYTIDSVPEGLYSMEINDNEGKATLVEIACENDTTLPPTTLEPTVSISGAVAIVDTTPLFIQVYGLERLVPVDPVSGEYTIDDLPAGSYTINIIAKEPSYPNQQVATQELLPNDSQAIDTIEIFSTKQEDYSQWLFSNYLSLNTTETGAQITENIIRFPILIRFDSSNFDFSQAQRSGHDIRITTLDSIRLPYEIESWDSTAEYGAIWVLLDTIYSDRIDSLRIFWGKTNAPNHSFSPSVFETTNGFAGVWHMEVDRGVVPDATLNSNHGTPIKYDGDEQQRGIIGTALKGDGQDDYIDVGNDPSLQITNTITISCWIKGNGFGRLINKHGWGNDNRGYSLYVKYEQRRCEVQIASSPSFSVYGTASEQVALDQWNYLAFVYDMKDLYIQTNNAWQDVGNYDSTINNSTESLSLQAALDGNYPKNRSSTPMDEIRISNVARSTAWISLCYMNQKEEDLLVEWGN